MEILKQSSLSRDNRKQIVTLTAATNTTTTAAATAGTRAAPSTAIQKAFKEWQRNKGTGRKIMKMKKW